MIYWVNTKMHHTSTDVTTFITWISSTPFLAVFLRLSSCLFVRVCLLVFTTDLPVGSPLCHAVLKTLQRWEQVLQRRLEIFGGPPSKYISTHLQDESATPGPALLRHKALYEPSNTPFRYNHMKYNMLLCLFIVDFDAD